MAGPITIVGLGPGTLDRVSTDTRQILFDAPTIIVRTLQHPAAEVLAQEREVQSCDDLYDSADAFGEVYDRIAERVVSAAEGGAVVYAVPGSPLIAERSLDTVRAAARAAQIDARVIPGISFLDEMFLALEFDPAARGFQLLDGRDLPDPMLLHLPTVIFHCDLPMILSGVVDRLGRVLPEDTPVTVTRDLGSSDASVATMRVHEISPDLAGLRTSLFLDPPPVGYVGAVTAMRRLRVECPWDREQSHDSLIPFALEEVSELVEALSSLTPGAPGVAPADYGPYADIEDELGDVLLQVIFHANLAAEVGAFDIEDVAEQLRRKLVRRHPHVFGDVEVDGADEVVRNWHQIKADEGSAPASLMDGVPAAMTSLARAAKVQNRAARVGFDWTDVVSILEKVEEELAELRHALGTDEAGEELGDLLFAVVNVARHLGVESDVTLRRATNKFIDRFLRMEAAGPLDGLTIEQLNDRWDRVKLEDR
ncbi:MAG: nucleoside triphosphate pyrophosphohydrolase [Acidimicrobiia bacterium]|nr:nucleoside triphosphate pyrophosphohydrolase [Acidimicrobiia bacterium]